MMKKDINNTISMRVKYPNSDTDKSTQKLSPDNKTKGTTFGKDIKYLDTLPDHQSLTDQQTRNKVDFPLEESSKQPITERTTHKTIAEEAESYLSEKYTLKNLSPEERMYDEIQNYLAGSATEKVTQPILRPQGVITPKEAKKN